MKNVLISLQGITKFYNKELVISNLNLTINDGEFVTLLGPSGSGKSTILKMIAGFEQPNSGRILLNNLDIKDLPINQRPITTVFQDYALFPTMTVKENIVFALKKKYVIPEQVSKKLKLKLEKLKEKSFNITQKKLEENKKLKFLCHEKILKIEANIQTWKWIKKKYLKFLKYQWNDLDFWRSYWQTYSLITIQKFQEKFILQKLDKHQILKQTNDILKLVGLNDVEHKYPDELSGGQQQRVGLARAIVNMPKILLLDEPLSALDVKVKKQLQIELKKLHKNLGITFILVTHDQEEALVLSDKIIVINKGKIEQIGTPSEIYDSPINIWVSNFIGQANIFNGVYLEPGKVLIDKVIINTEVKTGFKKNQFVYVMMRPEDYDVVPAGKGIIDVYVKEAIYKGQFWELKCTYMNKELSIENIDIVEVGQIIGLMWDAIDVHIMSK